MKRTTPLLPLLILVACFDAPVKMPVDLETTGLALERRFEFRYADRYSYGFAFRPTFVADSWHVADFTSQEGRAWAELCPSIDLIIRDSNGKVVLRDSSKISRESGWSMTNGSQDGESPAEVYKFIPFTPDPRQRYHLTLNITEPCSGANALAPRFFIERPMAGP